MSGFSEGQPCPICNDEMDVYTDHKPFNHSSGACIYCGFYFQPKVGQMELEEINTLRTDYNENNDPSEDEKLKPLTKKDLKKYARDIKNFW